MLSGTAYAWKRDGASSPRRPSWTAKASSQTGTAARSATMPASGSSGRKRHILVDTLGLLLGVIVTPASCPEREGAQQVLSQVAGWYTRLRKLWVDGGYTGENFAHWVTEHWPKLEVEVVKRSDDVTGFSVLPKRWIVERTFAWLMQHRRLVRDYERTQSSAEAWVQL